MATKKKASRRSPAKPVRKALRKPAVARRSPGKVKLSLMCGDYEIVRALKDGTVKPKGIDLQAGGYPGTRAIHDHVARGAACDINEYNGGHYVVQKAHGREDVTAIPVFLHRRFRHGFIYINPSKGIARPADLAGRRVACRTIGAAAAYWKRDLLVFPCLFSAFRSSGNGE